MEVISVDKRLPKNNTFVLVHLTKDNWFDSDDPQGGRYWVVAKFRRGLTQQDRGKLPDGDPKKEAYGSSDEWCNNERGFDWKPFGRGNFFGQEVDYWCELPTHPGIVNLPCDINAQFREEPNDPTPTGEMFPDSFNA